MHRDSHVITNDATTKPFVTEPTRLSTRPVALWALVHSCLFAPAANAHPATQHSVGALHMDTRAIPPPVCRPLATPGLSLAPSLSLNVPLPWPSRKHRHAMLGHACRRSRTSFIPLLSSLSRRIHAFLHSPLSLPRVFLRCYPHCISCTHHLQPFPPPSCPACHL